MPENASEDDMCKWCDVWGCTFGINSFLMGVIHAKPAIYLPYGVDAPDKRALFELYKEKNMLIQYVGIDWNILYFNDKKMGARTNIPVQYGA